MGINEMTEEAPSTVVSRKVAIEIANKDFSDVQDRPLYNVVMTERRQRVKQGVSLNGNVEVLSDYFETFETQTVVQNMVPMEVASVTAAQFLQAIINGREGRIQQLIDALQRNNLEPVFMLSEPDPVSVP